MEKVQECKWGCGGQTGHPAFDLCYGEAQLAKRWRDYAAWLPNQDMESGQPIKPAPIITVPNWPVTSVRHSKDLFIEQVQINVSRRSQLSHCYWSGDWT